MIDFFYLKKYLHEHKYSHLGEKFLLELEAHPDYPSLIAMVDVFNYYDIENVAARIDQSELPNLPDTFISIFCTYTGNEIVYTKKIGQDFEIQFANGFVQKLSRSEYLAGWNGMIVAIEENENAENVEKNILFKSIPLFLLVTIGFAFFQVYTNNIISPFLSIGYFIASFLGLTISIFLVREDLGFHDTAISKICYATKKTSCKEVLHSKKAKILGGLKLTDLSLIYFLGLTVFSIFTEFQDYIFIYSCLAFFSIPVMLYSAYVQSFIVKKWCILCLGILLVLVIQVLMVLNYGFSVNPNFAEAKNAVVFLFALIYISFLFLEIKRLIKNNLTNNMIELKYNQLKRKYPVFKALIDGENSVEELVLEKLQAIVIGKENAPITINAVLSASCMHCHKVYEKLVKLQAKNPDYLKVKLVFNINVENLQNPYNIIYKQAIAYYLKGEYNKAVLSLNEWHIDRLDFEQWKLKWQDNYSEIGIAQIQSQYQWCLENKIFYTPAILVNGQLLPKEYEAHELNFFIDNLIEEKIAVF
ncbi:vitamin K epoxide reductase family protein [Flavobacterium sp. UBA4854]|uniref:vitamin K epoxide reductase family protein n=1 Tax=Flavobacterium sp. UBA4854 TaxID=1946548 RepID=UPI00257E9C0B|nr:vitamin K epoxide reductase family protein [Flavobacterium sp. UBA4854]